MRHGLRRLAARLPVRWQQALKRRRFARRIRAGRFRVGEPEYDLLPSLVERGDWVLDIGANVGHYTLRLSELVGDEGRVIGFEPVPETFELLARHAAIAPRRNITLINAAASDAPGISTMRVPCAPESGLRNYYRARLTADAQPAGFGVLTVPIDSLALSRRVGLVKIDTEGHELRVLRGMACLLERDRPTLIVEDGDPEVERFLGALGYRSEKLAGSCNRIFRPRGAALSGLTPRAERDSVRAPDARDAASQ